MQFVSHDVGALIEGFPTDVDEHVDAYLQGLAGEAADVYAFGRSGWYLAQYVALARYAGRLRPDTYVVFINDQDLHDSLRENGVKTPYAYQINPGGRGLQELQPPGTSSSPRAAATSATARSCATCAATSASRGSAWRKQSIEDANLRPDAAAITEEVSELLQRATDYM